MRSSCYTLLGSCPPTLGLHPNGNPPCGDCVKPFFVRHRGRLNASIRHCVPGPACTLFCRSFALRLIPHHDDFRHDTTFHLGLGCPTCSTGTHEPTECNRPTVFHGATATRLMAIGSIDADLRTMYPITLFRGQSCHRSGPVHNPFICMRAFGCEPHTAHTTLAVPCRPLAKGFEKPSRIRLPALFANLREPISFLGRGRLLPLPGLQSTTRPYLRAPMGGAYQRLRLSLLGWSYDIAEPCIRVPPNHAFQ